MRKAYPIHVLFPFETKEPGHDRSRLAEKRIEAAQDTACGLVTIGTHFNSSYRGTAVRPLLGATTLHECGLHQSPHKR